MSFHYEMFLEQTVDEFQLIFEKKQENADEPLVTFSMALPKVGFYGHQEQGTELDEDSCKKLGETMIRLFYVLEENSTSESWILADAMRSLIELHLTAGPDSG